MLEPKNDNEKVIKIFEEILKWIKVTSFPKVRKLLLETLTDNKAKIAYQFSDGTHNQKEVAIEANVATGTISNWWKAWIIAGLAEPVHVRGGDRAKRTFNLIDFGFELLKLTAAPKMEEIEDNTVPQTEAKSEIKAESTQSEEHSV